MKELEMNWTEIKVEVPAQMVEKAGNIANMVVPYGIYIEDYSNLEEEATGNRSYRFDRRRAFGKRSIQSMDPCLYQP